MAPFRKKSFLACTIGFLCPWELQEAMKLLSLSHITERLAPWVAAILFAISRQIFGGVRLHVKFYHLSYLFAVKKLTSQLFNTCICQNKFVENSSFTRSKNIWHMTFVKENLVV